MSEARWIIPIRQAAGDRVQLLCFHYAGGSARSFCGWSRTLAQGISILAVQLPGRDPSRPLGQTQCLRDLMPMLFRAWQSSRAGTGPAIPFAFYGHSLGALAAFELSRMLRNMHRPLPAALIVSGRRAPCRSLTVPALCDLPDAELLTALTRLEGMPSSLLGSDKWRSFVMPTLRADLRLSDHYQYTAEEPLTVPISAFTGDRDPLLTPEEVVAWRHETKGGFSMESLPGAHFFNQEGSVCLQARIATLLSGIVQGDQPAENAQPREDARPGYGVSRLLS